MEPRLIFRTMARQWWIFLTVILITVGTTLFLTLRQTPIYRAKGTYIIRLSSEITDAKTVSTVLDSLNRYAELQGTYSEIAMSQMIKRQAGSKMELPGSELRKLSVSSRTLPGSKILEITVQGENPELIRDFTKAVGEETMTYVNELYPSYEMTPLDPPNAPNAPISPKVPFNLIVGTLLGTFLGFVAVLISSWLRGDFKNVPAIPSDPEEPRVLVPLKTELELLLQQCGVIRAELNETRELIHNTESEARTLRTMLNNWSKNGSSRSKEKKTALEEQNETGYVEHESSSE
jgi:capsular polysaccharide biosynthesis protein